MRADSIKSPPAVILKDFILRKAMFKKAKWIINADAAGIDTYSEYLLSVPFDGEKIQLSVSCDGAFAAFKNDEILPVAFSACADMPDYKLYDCFDLSGRVKGGDKIRLQVYHGGENTANYIAAAAGVIFELVIDGKIALYSDENTPSRLMNEYKNGYKKQITPQLGFSFFYDGETLANKEYKNSVLGDSPAKFYLRKIKNQVIGDFIKGKVIKCEKSVLLDLGKETTGFLYLDINCKTAGVITVAYGEHISDGGVRRKVGDCDFSVEYRAKAGENRYINCFRRLGCRYLEIFADDGVINAINAAGIYPTGYPVKVKVVDYGNEVINEIYTTCVETLKLCMHEHYEDCPWREQGMYCFDGRNQALCGYYAFDGGNAEYARANLVLISKSVDKYGLLSLCATGGTDYPIPFFSLAYFLAVSEYVGFTGDKTLPDEVKPTLDKLYSVFKGRIEENGLIARFNAPFWNFYEWSDGNDNYDSDLGKDKDKPKEKEYHCALNCAFVLADGAYRKLFGLPADGIEKTVEAITRTFENADGSFKISDKGDKTGCLVSALAILAGAALDEKKTAKLIADRLENGEGDMVLPTLSAKGFVYDALLKADRFYGGFILDDIERTYVPMLKAGATSFWETELGADDFGGIGSLCHGWSAMPIYYFANVLKK